MIARHRQSRRRSSSLRAHAIALSRSYMRLCLRRHVMDTRRARTHVHVYVVLSAILSVAYSARFVMHRHFVFPRENFACQSTNGKVNRIHDATRGRLPPAGRERARSAKGRDRPIRIVLSYREGAYHTWRQAHVERCSRFARAPLGGLPQVRSSVSVRDDSRVYLFIRKSLLRQIDVREREIAPDLALHPWDGRRRGEGTEILRISQFVARCPVRSAVHALLTTYVTHFLAIDSAKIQEYQAARNYS